MTILRAHSIKKSFFTPQPIEVLSDISLTIRRGESVAICGRSGEGKTTLLHILGTLTPPDAGTIFLNEELVTIENSIRLRRDLIGWIFQSFNLLEDFSVIDNILMPARIQRRSVVPNSIHHQRALSLVEEVNISHLAHMPVKQLSGGERQRVAIARALANEPSLILADEPSGNLDRANAQNVGEILIHCVKTKKIGLVLVTHDPQLAALCDHRYTLADGFLHRRESCA